MPRLSLQHGVSGDHRYCRAADLSLTRGGGFEFPLHGRRRERPLPGADTSLQNVLATHCDVSTMHIIYQSSIYVHMLSVRDLIAESNRFPFSETRVKVKSLYRRYSSEEVAVTGSLDSDTAILRITQTELCHIMN